MPSIEQEMDEIYISKDEYIKKLKSENTRLGIAKIKTVIELFSKPRVRLVWGSGNRIRELTVRIYQGKLQQIMEAQSSEDLKMILMFPKVYYNGCKVIPENKWVLPEEELIVWSNISMLAPLSQEGFERYMEVFKQIFPREAEEILKI